MVILGTICCRGGSKGIPGKNIKLLHGRPLLAYTIDTAKSCKYLTDLIVSTDDAEIIQVAKQYGATVPFIRPASLATDTASKWPVFIHVVEAYERSAGVTVDYIVDMDVTVPLKTAADIDGAIQMALSSEEADVVITGYEPERNPYFNMMELDTDNYAHIVKQPTSPIVRRQDAPVVYSLSPAAYVIKRSALFAYGHWSQAKCKIYPMPRKRAVDIDTEIDFKIVEALISINKNEH